jgi:putative protease
MKNNKKIELLSPAGNLEKMKTALAFGADAVYAGIPDFSLRVRINDFDMGKIKEATKYCHKRGKKIYITVNIFAHNKHIDNLAKYIEELKLINVDALIISDPGILMIVKEIWPDCEIHLSTQANATNALAVKFWQEQGIKRIILGREVTLEEIREIHRRVPTVELEYFVHGAMCMAYSGRCFLSKETSNRSANQGDCIQPCRWAYSPVTDKHGSETDEYGYFIQAHGSEKEFEVVEEEHGTYILNSKDLCLLKYLNKLAEAGVVSFKIEGRAKSVYYQAVVAGIYSRITHNVERVTLDKLDYYYSELENKLVHRGYTEGFLLGGKAEQNVENSHNKCAWEFCGQALSIKNYQLRIKNLKGKSFALIKVHNSLKVGDEIEIVMAEYDIIKMKVEKIYDVENGEELREAHGGQGKMVFLVVDEAVPEYSVIRRKLQKGYF